VSIERRFALIGHTHGDGGVADHGALTGLADDDHTQYLNESRGDARYSQLGHSHNYLPSAYLSALGVSDANSGDSSYGLQANYLNSGSSNMPPGTDHALLTLSYNTDYSFQMAGDWRTNTLYTRKQEAGTWGSWVALSQEGHTHAYLPLSGGTLSGGVGLGNNILYGGGVGDTFTYDGDTMPHYGVLWYSDSEWSAFGAGGMMSAYGGLRFFTQGALRLSINTAGTASFTGNISAAGSATFTTGTSTPYLYDGSGTKLALQMTDAYLRLNQSGQFSSGTYTPGVLRADGGLQAGLDGTRFDVSSEGIVITGYYTDHQAERLHEWFIPEGSAVRSIYVRFHQGNRWYNRLRAQPGVISYVAGAGSDGLNGMRASYFSLNDADTLSLSQTGAQIRVITPSGYGDIGPANAGYFHLSTDRPAFYFAQGVELQSSVKVYGTSVQMSSGGFYTDVANDRRIGPLSGSYGAFTITGSANGWAGHHVGSSARPMYLMFGTGSDVGGIYDGSVGWRLYWDGSQWQHGVSANQAIPYCTYGSRCAIGRGTAAPSGGNDGDVYYQYV